MNIENRVKEICNQICSDNTFLLDEPEVQEMIISWQKQVDELFTKEQMFKAFKKHYFGSDEFEKENFEIFISKLKSENESNNKT